MRLPLLASMLFTSPLLAQSAALKHYYPVPPANPPQTVKVDVCVYGGTPGGVATAVQASRMGKSAALVVFRKHVGGMTSGGLTASDLGRADAIGGIAIEFYKRIGQNRGFRPSKAEETFRALLTEANVPVYFEHRLKDVHMDGKRITAITCENGNRFEAKIFVDTTYEGDLFAKAGVSYHVGRESNDTYKETLNGVQFRKHHNFDTPVDPYRVPGDPKSGLLWGISSADPGKTGDGDKKVQAYNFRMFLSNAEDRLPFPKPADYDRDRYLLLLRYIKQGAPPQLQLHNGDSNNQGGFSTDHIGANYAWPEGDYATREKIFQDHVAYQQGLMWFWVNDPEVPKPLQDKVRQWGLHKDEFPETGGWPHELYVREGRRMVSSYVMTEHNCLSRIVAEDSVGLASYNMDSHNCQRVVVNGMVKNEGDVQVGCPKPYPVSYRSIVPKEEQCVNLFVPVCLSSSHIAYGSIRMEPVFMILGQSAGTAAALAIDNGISVQKVEYAKLREKLLADKQVLEWTGPAKVGAASISIPVKDLKGIVVDNDDAKLVGEWASSAAVGPFVGQDYQHDGAKNQGKLSATYAPKLPAAGEYEVWMIWTQNGNRATNVPVEIVHPEGVLKKTVNQRSSGGWHKLATLRFNAGTEGKVIIRNDGADGHVIIDAVRWVPVEKK
jgi:hypothetical protein